VVPAPQLRAEAILSRLGKSPVGAELGVFRGALSRRLLTRTDLRLIMVDSWGDYRPTYEGSGDYCATMSDAEKQNNEEISDVHTRFAEDRRRIIKSDTVAASAMVDDASLDFVFVDADHSYEGCRRDIDAWVGKLRPGGLLCGHDYDRTDLPNARWGVKQAVTEFAEARGLTVELGEDHTWFIRMPGPLPDPSDTYDTVTFACVWWDGGDGKYDASYVNILADMVARNCELPGRFICLTNTDGSGLAEDIEVRPLPPGYDGWWNKLALFHPDALPVRSRIVFLDLDVIVCGPIEDLVRTKGIAADWLQGGYNSSVMVWDHGEHVEAWNLIRPQDMARLHGDQDWLTELGGWDYLPTDWIVSYRLHAQTFPPEGAKVVAFHGWPKPGEFDAEGMVTVTGADGRGRRFLKSPWVPEMWSMGGLAIPRYTSQLNNDIVAIRANVTANVANDVPRIDQVPAHDGTLVISAGGPSLASSLPSIALAKARGATVWSVNGVHDYLIDRGIVPDGMVMLDSRAACVDAFLSHPHPDVEYLIATQCDPAAFDRLIEYRVKKWTGWYWGVEAMDDRYIGGGATVGLKSIALGYVLGYRRFMLFGYDSSYAGDADHAYPQPMNANDLRVDVVLKGRKFTAARWMAKQVVEFLGMAAALTALGCEIQIHGDGLLPMAARIAGEAEQRKVA
jgi:hypothetical protein